MPQDLNLWAGLGLEVNHSCYKVKQLRSETLFKTNLSNQILRIVKQAASNNLLSRLRNRLPAAITLLEAQLHQG